MLLSIFIFHHKSTQNIDLSVAVKLAALIFANASTKNNQPCL